MTDDERSIERSIEIDVPVGDVWRAISDADELVRWFSFDARVTPEVGGSVWISWGEGLAAESRIEIWEPGKRLRTAIEFPGEDAATPVRLALDFLIEGRGGQTTLRIVHSGFGRDQGWDDEYDGTSRGWRWFLMALRHYLERHHGRPRRAVAARARVDLSPEAAWERVMGPRGLRAAGTPSIDLEAGARYSFVTAAGHTLEGEVLIFDPPFQFAGTLSNLDDGLLLAEIEVGVHGTSPSLLLSLFDAEDVSADAHQRACTSIVDDLFPPDAPEAMGTDFRLARGLDAAEPSEGDNP